MELSNKECEGSILAFLSSKERGSMSKEIIQHNNKKITKVTKQNGRTSKLILSLPLSLPFYFKSI